MADNLDFQYMRTVFPGTAAAEDAFIYMSDSSRFQPGSPSRNPVVLRIQLVALSVIVAPVKTFFRSALPKRSFEAFTVSRTVTSRPSMKVSARLQLVQPLRW